VNPNFLIRDQLFWWPIPGS